MYDLENYPDGIMSYRFAPFILLFVSPQYIFQNSEEGSSEDPTP